MATIKFLFDLSPVSVCFEGCVSLCVCVSVCVLWGLSVSWYLCLCLCTLKVVCLCLCALMVVCLSVFVSLSGWLFVCLSPAIAMSLKDAEKHSAPKSQSLYPSTAGPWSSTSASTSSRELRKVVSVSLINIPSSVTNMCLGSGASCKCKARCVNAS